MVDLELLEVSPAPSREPRAEPERRDRRRRWAVLGGAIALVLLCSASSGPRTGPLLGERTGSVLWYTDREGLVHRLDLDSGHTSGSRIDGGLDLVGLDTSVMVFRGDGGADVIGPDLTVQAGALSRGIYPLVDEASDTLWALDDAPPGQARVWRRYAPPWVVADAEYAADVQDQPVRRAGDALVVARTTSLALFDVDRATTVDLGPGCAMLANRHAVAVNRSCLFPARVEVTGLDGPLSWVPLPASDRWHEARLSPDGRLLALPVGSGATHRLEIIDTATGRTVGTGPRDAFGWAWTRDSRFLVVQTPDGAFAWRVPGDVVVPLPVELVGRFVITR